ncbi:MAG: hypothetical protein WA061_03045 [Microgenomates group bacterium]
MNKFLLYIGILTMIVFFGLKPTFAQTTTFTGCGDSTNPTGNKCCSAALITTQDATVRNNIGSAWDIVLIPINKLLSSVSAPFNNMLMELVGGTLKACASGVPSTPSDTKSPNCICLDDSKSLGTIDKLCQAINDTGEKDRCSSCLVQGGIWSSIGCLSTDLRSFIENVLLKLGIGLAGGTSFLCILFAAFQMQTSGGNAEKLKKAQELLTNCITGLMVIIFSMLILKIIGVDILRIPGFS